MGLGIRDLFSTMMTAVVGWMFYVLAQDRTATIFGSNQIAAAALLGVGLAICITGNRPDAWPLTQTNPLAKFIATMGFLSIGFAIWSMITGSYIITIMLAIIILVMWLLTTLRHLLTKEPV